MACDELEPCKEARCARAGICNCSFVYDDGSTVPGSGRENDPYIIERPKFNCIKDARGNELPISDTRCVTLPPFLSGFQLEDTGEKIFPNTEDGVVTLEGCDSVNDAIWFDEDGNSILIEDNEQITFRIDDNGTLNKPTIVGNDVIFPGLKCEHAPIEEISLPIVGGPFVIATIPITVDTPKHVDADIDLGVRYANAFVTPEAGDYCNIDLDYQASWLTITHPIRRDIHWSRTYGWDFHQFYANMPLTVPVGTHTVDILATINNAVDPNNNLPGNLLFEGSVMYSWA